MTAVIKSFFIWRGGERERVLLRECINVQKGESGVFSGSGNRNAREEDRPERKAGLDNDASLSSRGYIR
jgi:hypothetical protein